MGGESHRLAGSFLLCPAIPPTTMEWSKLSDKKNSFIRDVILSNTISAAFSQAIVYRVYEEKPENKNQIQWDGQKKKFRENIGNYLVEIGEKYDPVNNDHSERIQGFKEKIENDATNNSILMNGQISFGRAQKLVNMYLKYLWCLGKFDTPPHCPIDRGILKEIGLEDPPWTSPKFTKKEYEKAIKLCEIKAAGQTLSEWELFIWRGNSSASVDKPGRNKSEKYLQIK